MSGIVDITIRATDDSSKGIDSAERGFDGLGKAAAAGMAVAAAAVAGVGLAVAKFGEMLSNAMDVEKGRDRLKAQLGLTAEESAMYGEMAGNLYADAYGESLDQVNDALRYVTQNIGEGVGSAGIENVTAQVMDLADAFEQDLGPMARAAGIMVKSGIANDATEALDLLAVGFQNGSDAGEDLLDTMTEYSSLFADLGISGPKAMGMISQAMRAGARDSDFVADAIKEFGIRSKDSSDLSRQAFTDLGLDANKMFQTFARGGPEADAAMTEVTKRLGGMKDPVLQNATAVALFGTKAEDLGSALYAIDPSTAVAAMGEVGGAAERVGDDLANNATTKLETFKRGIQQNVTDFMTNTVLPGLVSFAEGVGTAIGPGIDRAKETWNTFTAALRGEVTPPAWMQPIVDMVNTLQVKFAELQPLLMEFHDNVLKKFEEAWPHIQAALTTFYESALVPFFNFIAANSEQLKNMAVLLGIVLVAAVVSSMMMLTGLILVIGLVVAAVTAIIIGLQWLVQVVWDVFNNVRDALGGAIDKVEEVIQWFWDLAQNIGSAIADAARWVWDLATKVVEMGDAIFGKIGEVINWFDSLPGKIRDAVGNLGDLLVNAGRAILEGLVKGFEAALGWAKGKISDGLGAISNLFPHSPAKEGPFSGRGYTTYSGRALVEDFAKGITSGTPKARSAATSVMSSTGQNLGGVGAGLSGAANGGLSPVNIYVQGSIRSDRDLVQLIRDEFTNVGFAG